MHSVALDIGGRVLVLVQLAPAASGAVLVLWLGVHILPVVHALQDFQQADTFSFESSDPTEQDLTLIVPLIQFWIEGVYLHLSCYQLLSISALSLLLLQLPDGLDQRTGLAFFFTPGSEVVISFTLNFT